MIMGGENINIILCKRIMYHIDQNNLILKKGIDILIDL